MDEPIVRVGILGEHITKPSLEFHVAGSYTLDVDGKSSKLSDAACSLLNKGGKLALKAGEETHQGLLFRLIPLAASSLVRAREIPIGINFHWRRELDLEYAGELEFAPQGKDGLRMVNLLPAEAYVSSVALSEMGDDVHPEQKKAHLVIARSWYFAQVRDKPDQHQGFQVCNDDHCQRYQGVKEVSPGLSTRGEVIEYEGEVVDARYSKSCGGHTDDFATAWEDKDIPYLRGRPDTDGTELEGKDLRDENTLREYIEKAPTAHCGVTGADYKSMVQFYDAETGDFFRWRVEYEAKELGELVEKKTGKALGMIKALKPLRRGVSGRIIELEIVGEKGSLRVSKELNIRAALSETHLYSSCFVVDETSESGKIVLKGAGWGHGVGLCQIGAAWQAEMGKKYDRILKFYYQGTELRKLY